MEAAAAASASSARRPLKKPARQIPRQRQRGAARRDAGRFSGSGGGGGGSRRESLEGHVVGGGGGVDGHHHHHHHHRMPRGRDHEAQERARMPAGDRPRSLHHLDRRQLAEERRHFSSEEQVKNCNSACICPGLLMLLLLSLVVVVEQAFSRRPIRAFGILLALNRRRHPGVALLHPSRRLCVGVQDPWGVCDWLAAFDNA